MEQNPQHIETAKKERAHRANLVALHAKLRAIVKEKRADAIATAFEAFGIFDIAASRRLFAGRALTPTQFYNITQIPRPV